MKNLYKLLLFSMLFFSVTVKAQTPVGGAINSNTTWNLAGSPYLVQSNVAVMTGVTLTIDPGVTVKFDSQTSIQFFGTLRAMGTQSQPITFTSGVASPNPGDWGYILFNSSCPAYDFSTGTGCIMQHCIVEYAGGANVTHNGTVRMNNAFPYLNNCTIQNNNMPAVKAWGLSSTLHIDSCLVQYNNVDTGAVYASSGTLSMNGCNISNNHTSIATTDEYSVAGVFAKDAATRIKNCTFNDNNSRAICGCKKGYNIQTDSIANNTVTNNLKDGIYYIFLYAYYNQLLSTSIFILNNNITDNIGNGIYFLDNEGYLKKFSGSIFIVKGNIITNNSSNGIFFYFYSGSSYNRYTITNNSIFNNAGNGIECENGGPGNEDSCLYTIAYNIIKNNLINGIFFDYTICYLSLSNLYYIMNNVIDNNTGCGLKYDCTGDYYEADSCIVTNNLFNNNHNSGILFYFYPYDYDSTPYAPFDLPDNITMKKNKIINNDGSQSGAIIQSNNNCKVALTTEQNIIAGNNSTGQGGAVYMDFYDTTNVFTNNTLINNTASTSTALYYKGKGRLQADKNTIVYNNTTGTDSLRMVYVKQTQSFTHNNIYNSSCSSPILLWYDDYNGNTLNAQNCFWRKNQSTGIDSLIWDYFDDQNLAIVDHSNFETSPDTAAPVTPVENVIKIDLGGGNIKLTWSPNAETDLAGYKVYWGSPTGYSFANVVNVGNVLTYTIPGISITDTVAVTAYDTQATGTDDQVEGHESWFSGNYSNPFPTIIQNGATLSCYPAFSTYQWYDASGPVTSANQQQFTPAGPGIYYVVVTDNECTSTSLPFEFIPESIYSAYENPSFIIFPNPANSVFTVMVPAGVKEISIINSLGQIIKTMGVDNRTSIDFALPVNGIYFVRVTNEVGTTVKKIVVCK